MAKFQLVVIAVDFAVVEEIAMFAVKE